MPRKILRKSFRHPTQVTREYELDVPKFFGGYKKEKHVSVEDSKLEDDLVAVTHFAESLGDRLISISEYRSCRYRIGDDGYTNWVVWYYGE